MRRTQLRELAEQAGLKIVDEGFRVLYVREKPELLAVAVYADGTAHRADVELSITKNMTIAECAQHLDLVPVEFARDPRKDPKRGDVIKDGSDTKTVTSVAARKQGGMVVSYSGSRSGSGCVCGLTNWRSYYRKAEVLHVATDVA